MSEPDESPADKRILPLDANAMRSAPRVFSNYCLCTIEGDMATLIFAQRESTTVDNEETKTIALPQVMVNMTLVQFLKTAQLFERQAAAVKEQLLSLDVADLKEKLFGIKED